MLEKNFRNFSTLYLIIITIFISNIFAVKAYTRDNYIVSVVNNLPITKIDIINRAKLISFSIEKDLQFNNLKKFYNQSLNTLINERVIEAAGLKINKNINDIVSDKAYQITLARFNNSEILFNKFANDISIPKSTILNQSKSQLIWGMVLRKKYKNQFKNLEKKIETFIEEYEKEKNEDKYDIAEIVISKSTDSKLLNKIMSALDQGANFFDIAKQISISSSNKMGGKIGWHTYENLPDYIINNNIKVNEGDLLSFTTNNYTKIIKVLVKRDDGKSSALEKIVLLAQIEFNINFQKKVVAFQNIKKILSRLLYNKNSCNGLKKINSLYKKNINIKIIKSRIADLNKNKQNLVKNSKLYDINKPIYKGNKGYIYILCDLKIMEQDNTTTSEIKNNFLEKQYLIFSKRFLKKLIQEANIVKIEEIK